MAARTPRRTFANPFVVTIAATSACYATNSPPPQPSPVVAQGGQGGAVVEPTQPTTPPPQPSVNPPPPTTQPTQPTAVNFDQQWTIMKSGGACFAHAKVDCPKAQKGQPAPTCNPPPPIKYECPPEVTESASLQVALYAGKTECTTVPAMPTCPPNVACNPPRPRKVACPTP